MEKNFAKKGKVVSKDGRKGKEVWGVKMESDYES